MALIRKIHSKTLAKFHKAEVECEVCLKRRIVRWYDNYKKKKHLCNSCAVSIGNTGTKRSASAKANMSKAQRKLGNGGVRLQSGYIQRIVDTPHPRHKERRNGKYVFEHILVVEENLGRFLEQHEIVHHIDGDKLNNSIDNLYVCPGKSSKESRSAHNKVHYSAEQLTFSLVKKGLVKLDRETGEYVPIGDLATLASEIL